MKLIHFLTFVTLFILATSCQPAKEQTTASSENSNDTAASSPVTEPGSDQPSEEEILAAEANQEEDILRSEITTFVERVEKEIKDGKAFEFQYHDSNGTAMPARAFMDKSESLVMYVSITDDRQKTGFPFFYTHYFKGEELVCVSIYAMGPGAAINEAEEKFFFSGGKPFAYEYWRYIGSKRTLENSKMMDTLVSEQHGANIPVIFKSPQEVEGFMQE